MIDTKVPMRNVCLAALLAATGISGASAQQTVNTVAPASATPVPGPMPDILQKYTPVTTERLKKPEDGNWLMFRRTYDGWGYSPLNQITPRQCEPPAAGLELRHRSSGGPPGAADRE